MIRLDSSFRRLLAADDVGSLAALLQHAIELEHSTIPPYLYALYSSNSTSNPAVANIIRSVVIEEMLHLTLAANVLNAVGGSPSLDRPDFVPKYPGHLPGGVDGGLVVHLAPCSIDLIKQVFMSIEEPEHPLDYPGAAPMSEDLKSITIGAFYRGIEGKIKALDPEIFTANAHRHQIGPDLMDNAVEVKDTESALKAISIIIEQGEGTSRRPTEAADSTDYAHYYRFSEIVEQGMLEVGGTAGYYYDTGGHPITLDSTAVFQVPTDPKAANYRPGTAARQAIDTFNYNYSSLLITLHSAFNGQAELINFAVDRMDSLRSLAIDMMNGTAADGIALGPTFEVVPINPRS